MAALRLLVPLLGRDMPKFEELNELVKNLALFYDVCMFHGMWLTDSTAREASDALLAVGVYHQALCSYWMGLRRQLFHLTEKAHYAQHIALDMLATRVKPRWGWTYADEDYMGRLAQVAKACLRARGMVRVGEAFIFRWRNRVNLLWRMRSRVRV